VKHFFVFFLLFIVISGKGQQALTFKNAETYNPSMGDQAVLSWNEKQTGYNKLTSDEKDFYYWVNYSRLKPKVFYDSVVVQVVQTFPQLKGKNFASLEIDMENANNLPLLSLSEALTNMASYHAKDITSNNASPSHNSTNGDNFGDRFKKFGLKNCGGENISYGSGGTNPLFMLVLLYLDINVTDLGHRKALLNLSYINTGISIEKFSNGNSFLVEDFACNQQ
jgi:Cysteine-rich secretory protein family